jgi:hypothetical protein
MTPGFTRQKIEGPNESFARTPLSYRLALSGCALLPLFIR